MAHLVEEDTVGSQRRRSTNYSSLPAVYSKPFPKLKMEEKGTNWEDMSEKDNSNLALW